MDSQLDLTILVDCMERYETHTSNAGLVHDQPGNQIAKDFIFNKCVNLLRHSSL